MQIHDESESIAAPRRAHARADGPASDVSRSIADPGTAQPSALLELQRLAGNASVSRLVAPREEEIAEAPRESGQGHSPVLDIVGKGGGDSLDPSLRAEMEGRLGGDFGDVRVHRDATAGDSARSVDANAYTVGADVVFAPDRWSPGTAEGKHTLAHELTHVLQQRAGPVAGTETGDGVRLSHPADDFERAADQNADVAMSAPTSPDAGPSPAAGSMQRQAASPEEEELPEEEEVAQGEFVQRQGDEEEEIPEEEEVAQGEFVQRQGDEEEEIPEEETA